MLECWYAQNELSFTIMASKDQGVFLDASTHITIKNLDRQQMELHIRSAGRAKEGVKLHFGQSSTVGELLVVCRAAEVDEEHVGK